MKSFSPKILQVITIILIVGGVLLLALAGYLQPVLGTVSSPFISMQRWLSSRYFAISDLLTMPRDITVLRQQNSDLKNEVSRLESQIIQLQQQVSEAQVLYALLDFARANPENQYIAASVIGKDPSPFLQYIIIDHGSDDGIRHGMPVVTEQGLVGRIDAVTATAAKVQLINDIGSVVNIRLETANVEAQLAGSITGEVSVEMIPQDATVFPGDIILTSGLGGNYPANIVVGQVINVRKIETDLFQTATVQPIVDLSQVKAVLVITNFQPADINSLIPTTVP
jgi:rod shape-determining protein MreC